MYKKILVPLDGSKRAEAILPHIESLVCDNDTEVIFIQVVEPPRIVVEPYETMVALQTQEFERRKKETKDYLQARQEAFERIGIKAGGRLAHGPIVEAIISTAEDEDVDLIAMASHGRGGIARFFYGSVAAGVLQRVERPLLLIRATGKEG